MIPLVKIITYLFYFFMLSFHIDLEEVIYFAVVTDSLCFMLLRYV